MSLDFDEDVWMFISLAQKHNVEMLMVGGGAVNFYGYQRHSADVDFWIDTTPSNLVALREAHKTINKTRCSYHVDFGDFTGFTTDLFI